MDRREFLLAGTAAAAGTLGCNRETATTPEGAAAVQQRRGLEQSPLPLLWNGLRRRSGGDRRHSGHCARRREKSRQQGTAVRQGISLAGFVVWPAID